MSQQWPPTVVPLRKRQYQRRPGDEAHSRVHPKHPRRRAKNVAQTTHRTESDNLLQILSTWRHLGLAISECPFCCQTISQSALGRFATITEFIFSTPKKLRARN